MSECDLRTTLASLALALTGKPLAPIPAIHLNWLIEGQEFYLPDGGYSRIVVSPITGEARLTSNSREPVKAAWGRCHDLVVDLERQVHIART